VITFMRKDLDRCKDHYRLRSELSSIPLSGQSVENCRMPYMGDITSCSENGSSRRCPIPDSGADLDCVLEHRSSKTQEQEAKADWDRSSGVHVCPNDQRSSVSAVHGTIQGGVERRVYTSAFIGAVSLSPSLRPRIIMTIPQDCIEDLQTAYLKSLLDFYVAQHNALCPCPPSDSEIWVDPDIQAKSVQWKAFVQDYLMKAVRPSLYKVSAMPLLPDVY
jgi:hypothetical protein